MSGLLLEALARGPIVLDAAMGTRLIARGLVIGLDEASVWNLERPGDVLAVHQSDVASGSDALLTNTFCAGRNWLERFGLGDQTAAINARGVALARQAIGEKGLVLGSIGPTARGDFPVLIEQAEALAGAGADALVLETHTLEEAEAATGVLVGQFRLPVVASLRAWPDPIGDASRRIEDAGASALGVNCTLTLAEAVAIIRRLREVTALPLWAKPGLAAVADSPARFARSLPDLLESGVQLIGGCCGTTETEVAAIREALAKAGRLR